eukprot:jgi/Undpi1/4937/HiC_scaffold_19.g08289.m1
MVSVVFADSSNVDQLYLVTVVNGGAGQRTDVLWDVFCDRAIDDQLYLITVVPNATGEAPPTPLELPDTTSPPPTPPPAAGSDSAPAPTAAAPTAAGTSGAGVAEGVVAVAPAVGEQGGEGEEGQEDVAVYITVHPPRQPATAGAAASASAPLVLEPLAGVELVMQVRQLLGEIPQTCLYTAFRLVAVIPEGGEGGAGGGGEDLWKGKGEVMNDFVELRSIAAVVARPERVEVRMELDSYTTHTARQHVAKFRELLRYPPPCAEGMGPAAKAAGGGKKGKGKGGTGGKSKKAAPAATGEPSGEPGQETSGDPATDAMVQRVQRALDIRGRLKDSRVPVGGTEGLGCFYGVGLGLAVDEVAAPAKEVGGGGKDKDKDEPVTCLRGVSVSAWNPPPPQRRMVGDLIYLEGGFYVNGTRKGIFDPSPAPSNACHSHELAVTLLASSPSFAKAWNNAVVQAWKRIQSDDPVHALARAMREGRGDAVMVKPQWNMPLPDPKWAIHKADPSRAQEDLSNGFGIEDRGVPREWNDEYQCLLELPNDSPDLSMTRSRALHKLLSDFQEAATAGALAISDAEHSHVFVFNNIFFSFAADSPDAYKAISGEAAARKSASQDLASVVALNLLGEAYHPLLSIKTLATTVVDFCGRRLIAQSLVPGILNGDQTNKVVYGAMEHGQPLRKNDKVSDLLRNIGQRLMIAEREVDAVPIKKSPTPRTSTPTPANVEGEGEAKKSGTEADGDGDVGVMGEGGGETATVKVTGAVEMKGIVGSDGRSYLLDVSRLTPRDANWVRGEKGTGVYDTWMASQEGSTPASAGAWEKGAEADTSFEHMAVLRPELLTMFTRHKVAEWFRARESELLPKKNQTNTEVPNGEGGSGEKDSTSTSPPTSATPATVPPIKEEETIPSPSISLATEDEQESADVETKAVDGTDAGAEGEGAGGVVALQEGGKGEEVEAGVGGGGGGGGGFKAVGGGGGEAEGGAGGEGCIDPEQLLADENLAREAAKYLWDVALPFITVEVKKGSLSPLDCAELAQVLHGAGINVRYMGRLAAVAAAEEAEDEAVKAEGKLRRWRMPVFWLEMLETEMVARATGHVFNRYMAAGTQRARLAPGRAVQQFLNCLLGGGGGGADGAAAGENVKEMGAPSAASNGSSSPSKASTPSPSTAPSGSSWMAEDQEIVALTQEDLWMSVTAEVALRFRHRLTLWGQAVSFVPFRQPGGVEWGLDLEGKGTGERTGFGFVYAAEALEMAHLHLTSGAGLQTAHDFAQHAAALLLQACDGMHTKYPAALNLQARVMYLSGDADAAVALQLKALAYYEQLEGLDSSSVVKCHEQLGQYYMQGGLYDKALTHMRAFCYLAELASGSNHRGLLSPTPTVTPRRA